MCLPSCQKSWTHSNFLFSPPGVLGIHMNPKHSNLDKFGQEILPGNTGLTMKVCGIARCNLVLKQPNYQNFKSKKARMGFRKIFWI